MPFIKAAPGLRNMRAPNPEIAVSPNVFFFFGTFMSALVQHHLEEDAVSQRAGRMQSSALNRENNSFAYCLEMMGLFFCFCFFKTYDITTSERSVDIQCERSTKGLVYGLFFKGIASQ